MTEQQTQSRRELPAWVFLLIILLCIGGGIAFVVWYFRTPNPISEQVVLKSAEQIAAEQAERRRNPPARADRPPARRGAAQTAIRQVSRERGDIRTYQVSAGQITMNVRDVPRGDNEFTFRMPQGLNLLPFETRALARMRWRIIGDDAVAEYLRVTDAQRQQLRDLELTNDLVVPEESLSRMRALWREANPRRGGVQPEMEAQIIELLTRISADTEGPTRELWTAQLKPIESILTPEQIAGFRTMGRRGAQRPSPPATQPQE